MVQKVKEQRWVNIAKGIAILLVVFGHVLDSYLGKDLFVGYNSYIKYIRYTIYTFHMPLFFALSGYLYSYKHRSINLVNLKPFLVKKILNLGIPYLVFSFAFGLAYVRLSSNTYHTLKINDLYNVPFKPILQYWFIYALLFIFILVAFLDLIIKDSIKVFIILIIGKLVVTYLNISVPFILLAFNYGMYFYFGKVIQIYSIRNLKIKKYLCIITFLVYSIINIISYKFKINNTFDKNNIYVAAIVGILGTLIVILLCQMIETKNNFIMNLFSYLGKNSFEIYLIHRVFSYAVTLILIKLTNSILLNLLMSVVIGIIVPLCIKRISMKLKLLDFCFSPSKYIIKMK